jgi:putative phosphonate metabolism protein
MAHRYAVYFAPADGSSLDRFGTAWLGRDHRSGRSLEQPAVLGFDKVRLRRLTQSPRRYGFHATLKAPFRLRPDRTAAALHDAVTAFAAVQRALVAPPLEVADLEGFLAFVPSAPAPELNALAGKCVHHFEPFRAALTAAERQRRPLDQLTPRQIDQLDRFGYPYVFDDFVFHMTLTERLAEAERAILLAHLRSVAGPLAAAPLVVDAVAVYEEPTPGADFVMTARYGFGYR